MIKIKAISDTHGYLPDVGKVKLLLIGGDICPTSNHSRQYQYNWFKEYFLDWLVNIDFEDFDSKVILVPGNHDFFLESITDKKKGEYESMAGGRLKILINEEYTYEYTEDEELKSLRIFGTPYCKLFGNWAFMRGYEDLPKYYDKIPEGLDILLSHDAPDINGMGVIHSGKYSNVNAGNVLLADYIKARKPKYALCGHIHSGNHNIEEIDGVNLANISYVDEQYRPTNDYLTFEV